MGRKRFGDQNCAIARSLDIFGDGWSLLIIRDAFFGLLPILMTLREWGDTWVFGVGNEPLIMHDQKSGKMVTPRGTRKQRNTCPSVASIHRPQVNSGRRLVSDHPAAIEHPGLTRHPSAALGSQK